MTCFLIEGLTNWTPKLSKCRVGKSCSLPVLQNPFSVEKALEKSIQWKTWRGTGVMIVPTESKW